jgi:hypothetical protein
MLAKTKGWAVVAIVSLAVVGACAGGGQIANTPEMREQVARKIVRLEIESGGLDQRLDQGADLAQAYSLDTLRLELGRELTDQELERVRQIMRSVLGEFLTPELWEQILVGVYSANFTAPELQEIHEFFETPAGSKILRLSAKLTAEIESQTDSKLEGQLQAFVDRVDEELGKAFPALLEGGS